MLRTAMRSGESQRQRRARTLVVASRPLIVVATFGVLAGCASLSRAPESDCLGGKETVGVGGIGFYCPETLDALEPFQPGESESVQRPRLLKVWLTGSREPLTAFMQAWHASSVPATDSQLRRLPAPYQHAYGIFIDLYTPRQLGRFGSPEWGTNQFTDVEYLVVQNTIRIAVCRELNWLPSSPRGEGRRCEADYEVELQDFRPSIVDSAKALFLTDPYETMLGAFLGQEQDPFGTGNLMNPAHPKGQSRVRAELLYPHVRVYAGHWGGWRIVTDPFVSLIEFDESLRRAVVHFEIVYQGGAAYYERDQTGHWTMVRASLLWFS